MSKFSEVHLTDDSLIGSLTKEIHSKHLTGRLTKEKRSKHSSLIHYAMQ